MQDLSRTPDGKPSPWRQPVDWTSQKQLSQSTSYAATNSRTDTGGLQKSKEDRGQCQTEYHKIKETGRDEERCPCGEHWRCTVQ